MFTLLAKMILRLNQTLPIIKHLLELSILSSPSALEGGTRITMEFTAVIMIESCR